MELVSLLAATAAVLVGVWRWWPTRSIWPSPMSQQWVITHDHDARQLEWWRGMRRWR